MTRRYACSFTDATGARRPFWIEAESFDHAAELLEDLGASAQLDGELIEEGEACHLAQIGRA